MADVPAIQQPQAASAVSIEQQRAISEVHAQMMIARMNPRDTIKAIEDIKNACCRPGLAAKALYAYQRGGTKIDGPSIRLAEVLKQNWPHIQAGWRELDQRDGVSTVQAYAWDMQTNNREEITFQVPHVRYSKELGNVRLTDPRDIYEMCANQASRRKRNCILAVIPGDVIEIAVDQCNQTIAAEVDMSPGMIHKMVETFLEFGVTKAHIEKRIGRKVDSIHPAQVIQLRKIYVSLRDEMSSPEDWFEMGVTPSSPTEKPGISGLSARISAAVETPATGNGVTPPEPPTERTNEAPGEEVVPDTVDGSEPVRTDTPPPEEPKKEAKPAKQETAKKPAGKPDADPPGINLNTLIAGLNKLGLVATSKQNAAAITLSGGKVMSVKSLEKNEELLATVIGRVTLLNSAKASIAQRAGTPEESAGAWGFLTMYKMKSATDIAGLELSDITIDELFSNIATAQEEYERSGV